ncbi:DUF3302 domain-containing protein [Xanthobacter sp. DSM 24535]|uniref:DUF3302 domain-containing protein n=1 Tax=Roseixanthobacter psychrophilus TaxID=3119917 RepID=UPI00372A89FD
MSFLDLFAGIVLLVAAGSALGVILILGAAPGYVARRRGHPWADAVTVAGWTTLVFGLVFWPLAFIWAFVDVPARSSRPSREPAP